MACFDSVAKLAFILVPIGIKNLPLSVHEAVLQLPSIDIPIFKEFKHQSSSPLSCIADFLADDFLSPPFFLAFPLLLSCSFGFVLAVGWSRHPFEQLQSNIDFLQEFILDGDALSDWLLIFFLHKN